MSTESGVKAAFALSGNPPNGVEPFLGNDRNPLVAILGYNPGLNGRPHQIGAPTNATEMRQALDYFRDCLQGGNFAPNEFRKVWSRYCWMLDPGAATYPRTEAEFTRLVPNQLLVLNLYQSQTTNVEAMTPPQRKGKGQVALELLDSARPSLLVVQGADAWRWIRSQTRPVGGRLHLSYKLADIYSGHREDDVGYLVQFTAKPTLELPVLPVFHLTGKESYRPEATRFAALESRYRDELNRVWDRRKAQMAIGRQAGKVTVTPCCG